MYLYEKHDGGLFFCKEHLSSNQLYCNLCEDYDMLIGEFDNKEELKEILLRFKDEYKPDYLQELTDKYVQLYNPKEKVEIYIVCSDRYEWNNYLVTYDFDKAMDLLNNHNYSKDEKLEICGVEIWEDEKHISTYYYDKDEDKVVFELE